MKKIKVWVLLSLAICITTISVVEIFAKSAEDKDTITIRKVPQQVVLYTIYRGSYDKIGPAIGKLYALAGKNRIIPCGQVSYVYLNNPNFVSSEHWLTEIRIPVGKDALKAAGTLGQITDVKTVAAVEMAVAVKPQGVAEPNSIYDSLLTWIEKQGYAAIDSPCEIFLTGAMTGNYAQMKSEIMFPVKKLSSNKD